MTHAQVAMQLRIHSIRERLNLRLRVVPGSPRQ
jgi:hypothetical protein